MHRLASNRTANEFRCASTCAAVAAVCERILAAFAEPILYGGLSLEVGASIGVARCPRDALDAMALYKAADVARYAAKEAGRGVWRPAEVSLEVDQGRPG